MIYLDNAATTPVKAEVLKTMLPFFSEYYGNASNVYSLSLASRRALDSAREAVAKALNAKLPAEIFFTGCGTESDNLAVIGIAKSRRELGNHIITSAIEHHAVLNACDFLRREGFEITRLPVDKYGLVKPEQVAEALRPQTVLVSVMTANNEVGSLEPIAEIAETVRSHQAFFHTDAVQAVGAALIDVQGMGIDALSISAHKFGGPKGVGALYLRTGVRPLPVNYGGGQERGLRSGTENVPGIVGLAKAISLAYRNFEEKISVWRAKRDYLIKNILERVPYAQLTGHPEKRLPGHASFVFAGVEGESLVMQLDRRGVCASSGAACASSALGISHVLEAMKTPHARGSLRLTIDWEIDYADLDRAIEAIADAAKKLQSRAPKSAFSELK